MQYKVHLDDPSSSKGERRFTVSEHIFQALRDADDQLVRITGEDDDAEEWINRHRIIRVTRTNKSRGRGASGDDAASPAEAT